MKIYFITKIQGTRKEIKDMVNMLLENTYSSIKNQSCNCWEWHIYIPFKTPRSVEKKLKRYTKKDLNIFVYVTSIFRKFNSVKLEPHYITVEVQPFDVLTRSLTKVLLKYKHCHNTILEFEKNMVDMFYWKEAAVGMNIFDCRKDEIKGKRFYRRVKLLSEFCNDIIEFNITHDTFNDRLYTIPEGNFEK